MKFNIEKRDREVVIRFEQLDGQVQEVIDAIGRCRESTKACPSGECSKIAGMQAAACGESLAVTLVPRPDAELSIISLGECLKYQLPKTVEK